MNLHPNPALVLFVANPDHAILLLLCGILFIYAEFNKPGTVVLGCFGALLTMFALYGLSLLPIRPAAVAVALAGVVLVGVGCRFRTLGRIADVAGTLLIALGLANLVVSPPVHFLVAIVAAAIFSFVTGWLVRIALAARQNKSLVGPQAMIGSVAVVHTPLAPSGQVEVRGELWRATLEGGGYQPAGATVIVRGVQGLDLLVETYAAERSFAR
jgi:membrane-bound serine protease (ClpP class)